MIVKIQAAITSTEGKNMVLMYNEDRTFHWEGSCKYFYSVIKYMRAGGIISLPKIYVEMKIDNKLKIKDDRFLTGTIIENQDW